MTIEQHLLWARERALAALPNTAAAFASLVSDLDKHAEAPPIPPDVLRQGFDCTVDDNADQMKAWILRMTSLAEYQRLHFTDVFHRADPQLQNVIMQGLAIFIINLEDNTPAWREEFWHSFLHRVPDELIPDFAAHILRILNMAKAISSDALDSRAMDLHATQIAPPTRH